MKYLQKTVRVRKKAEKPSIRSKVRTNQHKFMNWKCQCTLSGGLWTKLTSSSSVLYSILVALSWSTPTEQDCSAIVAFPFLRNLSNILWYFVLYEFNKWEKEMENEFSFAVKLPQNICFQYLSKWINILLDFARLLLDISLPNKTVVECFLKVK